MIEIVTHCYSGHHRQYAVFLALQLESLCRYADVPVRYSLVTHQEDLDVISTAMAYTERLRKAGVEIGMLTMDRPRLHRRAIGRNVFAKGTDADCVWFCDVDYWFGKGCLSQTLEKFKHPENTSLKDPMLIFPRRYFIHHSHELGDKMLAKVDAMIQGASIGSDALGDFVIPEGDFYSKPSGTPIGGLQIVSGKWCREFGYLDGTEWVKPKEGRELAAGVQRTRDDVHFRKPFTKRKSRIGNLYRFRHSAAGRDIKKDRF